MFDPAHHESQGCEEQVFHLEAAGLVPVSPATSVQTHANAKRMHEQSNQHKKAVETKMREIRKTKQKEEREEEATKRALASIEAKLRRPTRPISLGARPEDTHGPKPLLRRLVFGWNRRV